MEHTHDAAQVPTTQAPATAPAAGTPEAPPPAENGQQAVPAPDQPAGQTPEQAEQDRAAHEAAEREAEKLAARGIAAYVAGQRAELRQTFEAAGYWHSYLVARMGLATSERGAPAQRAEGVKRLQLELAIKCQRDVRVNDLLRSWAAWRLLAEEPGLMGDARKPGSAYPIPLHVYRDVWSLLVERAEPDTRREHYVLLPGMEDRCRELFRHAAETGLAKGAADPAVRELVAEHARQQGAARRAEAERLALEQQEAERVRQAAVEQTEKAQEDVLAKTLAATQAAQEEEQRQRAVAEAEAAKQALAARQQELAKASASAEALAKAKARAEQQQREAQERAQRMQQKAEKGGRPRESRVESLLKPQAGKGDDPVARAAMAAEFIGEAEDPAAVLIGLLEKLARTEGLAQRVKTGVARKLLKLLSLAPDASAHQLDAAILALSPKTAQTTAGAAA
jgi:hypothetical protein